MRKMNRIENIEQLKVYISTLIDTELYAVPIEHYGLTFYIYDSIKKSQACLQKKLNNSCWDGYSYRDERMNILLLLNNAGNETICIATILSLHSSYLESFDY